MYELYDPVTVMFFFRNKHIMIDLGTGNNNKSTLLLILSLHAPSQWPQSTGQSVTSKR
jgi:hypothetical protein